MRNSSKPRAWRLALGAAVAGLLAVAGFGAPALAAPGNYPGGFTEGSLTVHKYEEAGNTAQFRPDGTGNDTSALTAIPDVGFTVRLVQGLDLTQSESWDILKRLQFTDATTATDPGAVAPQPSTYTLVDQATLTTDANGQAVFSGLPVGAYLVEETTPPAGAVATTAPFFISIPFPYENDWLQNVHVYPKNSVTQLDKVAGEPDGQGLGSNVPWTITSKIPVLAPGEAFTNFTISDDLDPRLTYAPAATDSLLADGVAVPATAYTLSAAGSDPVVLTFTAPEGLDWLAANQGKTLSWTLTTQVVSNDGDGSIENNVLATINDNQFTTETPGTSNWGALQILKHIEGDQTRTLSGAVFEVYESATGGTPIEVYVDAANPAQTQFTTGPDGTVLIPGLNVGPTGSKVYYLREVVAPAGFVLLTDRVPVTVTTSGVAAPVEFSVANTTDENGFLPNLPLTGGAGTIMLTMLGAGLLAAAGGAIALRRRRIATDTGADARP